MKKIELSGLTVPELVNRFKEIALAQDKADLYDEIERYNMLYKEMETVAQELRARSGDQRHALRSLYEDQNAQVRLKAAIHTLALLSNEAKAVLQTISDRDEYPQAADARGMLSALDEGRYVPN